MIGGRKLGVQEIGGLPVFINSLEFDLEYSSILPNQTQTVYCNPLLIETSFQTISNPQQVHIPTIAGVEIGLEIYNVSGSYLIYNPITIETHQLGIHPIGTREIGGYTTYAPPLSINNLEIENEFQAVEVFIDEFIIENSFESFVVTQEQNAVINNFEIGNEFDVVNAIQAHNIRLINKMEFASYFDNIPFNESEYAKEHHIRPLGVNLLGTQSIGGYSWFYKKAIQVHMLQPYNMQFEMSMNKIFPKAILGGYMFVTVTDNGAVYNLSFEGVESE